MTALDIIPLRFKGIMKDGNDLNFQVASNDADVIIKAIFDKFAGLAKTPEELVNDEFLSEFNNAGGQDFLIFGLAEVNDQDNDRVYEVVGCWTQA